jgi:hypothetical protein
MKATRYQRHFAITPVRREHLAGTHPGNTCSPATDRGTGSGTGKAVVEIHLEDFGQHSWVRALVNVLAGHYASAQCRFVARRAEAPHTLSKHVAVGATFPMMRFADLDDQVEPNTWPGLARERLDELDEELTHLGWRRRPERGRHR